MSTTPAPPQKDTQNYQEIAEENLRPENVKNTVSGAIYSAPKDALPPAGVERLSAKYINHGILTKDGFEEIPEIEKNENNGWQSNIKLRSFTVKAGRKYKFTLLESKKENIELYYGATVDEKGHFIDQLDKNHERRRFVIDLIDNEFLLRSSFTGVVSEVESLKTPYGESIGYGITVEATEDIKKWVVGIETVEAGKK